MELVTFNGLDGDSGGYLFPSVPLDELAAAARGAELDTPYIRLMRRRDNAAQDPHLGPMFTVRDPDDLAQAGWGLLTTADTAPDVLAALRPLTDLRREQTGGRYRELVVEPGERAGDFLWRHGMTAVDPADPRKVPYYLLIVGGPGRIPFAMQYELDVQYAVGRLDFDDPEDFASYAAAVVAAETHRRASTSLPVHLFGARNPDDAATALSASRLIEPLRDELRALAPHTVVTCDLAEQATRARLVELLAADTGPQVLLTATHGLGSSSGSDREARGALVCQDWPGPRQAVGRIAPQSYLSAADVPVDRALGPRVVFSFACYSAAFSEVAAPGRVSRLPQRLLANRVRPTLAFIGHVDRAWGYSFVWQGTDPQITGVLSTLLSISDGHRVGAAMEYLNARSAAITAQLAGRLEEFRRAGRRLDDRQLAWLWTASQDARNYIVLGDPAVRAGDSTEGSRGSAH